MSLAKPPRARNVAAMKRALLLLVALATTALAAPTKKPAPAAPSAPAAEKPKIEGIEVARAGGGYLGVALANGGFAIAFYDAERKPIAANVSTAFLRWPVTYKNSDEHVTLQLSSDGRTLFSPFNVRPPHTFRLFVSLFVDGKTDAVEAYTVQFHD